jgi:hypothetical protein
MALDRYQKLPKEVRTIIYKFMALDDPPRTIRYRTAYIPVSRMRRVTIEDLFT